jgi:hypothetical protein
MWHGDSPPIHQYMLTQSQQRWSHQRVEDLGLRCGVAGKPKPKLKMGATSHLGGPVGLGAGAGTAAGGRPGAEVARTATTTMAGSAAGTKAKQQGDASTAKRGAKVRGGTESVGATGTQVQHARCVWLVFVLVYF